MTRLLVALFLLAIASPAYAQFEVLDQDVVFGRSDQVWGGATDFEFSVNGPDLKLRKLFLSDIGDPADFGFMRAGPDGVDYRHFPPQAVTPGQNLGTLHWRGYQGLARGFNQRSAQIYARFWENAAGSLHLATSDGATDGAPDSGMQDRIVLEKDGTLSLPGVPFDGRCFRVRLPDSALAKLCIER